MSRWQRREPLLVAGLLLLMLAGVFISAPYDDPFPVLFFIWGFHYVASIRLIIAGVDVVSREHRNEAWEALILTGIAPRKIFFGKWRALLRRTWGWAVAMVIFWAGLVGLFLLQEQYPLLSYSDEKALVRMALLPVTVIMFAILELLCCTLLSVAASAVTKQRNLAALLAGSLRIVPSIFAGLLFLGIISVAFMMGSSESLYITLGLSDPGVLMVSLATGSRLRYVTFGFVAAAIHLIVLSVVGLIAGLWAVQRVER